MDAAAENSPGISSGIDAYSSTNKGRKRKLLSADPFARLAACQTSTCPTAAGTTDHDASSSANKIKTGRGSEAGWTYCPICYPFSKKLFARGRGIASHLHAVHTPWKAPSKAERKRRRQMEERQKRNARQESQNQSQPPKVFVETGQSHQKSNESTPESWEPTEKEMEEWNAKVLQIVKDLEESPLLDETDPKAKKENQSAPLTQAGVNRNGQVAKSYKASLPPFLQAASDGNFEELQRMLNAQTKDTDDKHQEVLALLNQTDRHGSIAEHWAAGGGHLACLKLLKETRQTCSNSTDHQETSRPSKLRRRDGKTSLHYAARNGHVHCIEYLLSLSSPEQTSNHTVDEISGDGTTPFHLACFGGHLSAIQFLVQNGADPNLANEWGCTAAHWIAMTKCSSMVTTRQVCRYLKTVCHVPFVTRQSQGHSPLHKAAQRSNRHVIEWLAQQGNTDDGGAGLSHAERQLIGQPDEGGYKPSDIWKSVGGDGLFGEWMKQEMGW